MNVRKAYVMKKSICKEPESVKRGEDLLSNTPTSCMPICYNLHSI